MKENLKALHGIRGLAAVYVMIHHARLALTQSYQNGLALHPEKYEWHDKAMVYFFSLFKFGHEAVIVFFVLSGFVIHLKHADSNYNFSNFKTFNYLRKRIIRIYPTLLVSFLLSIILDYVTHLLINESLLSLFSKYHYKDFFFNLFLIPDAPIWGYNFPVWSLKHEWFFYLFYPLLLWLSKKQIGWSLLIIIGLFISYFMGFKIPYIGPVAYTLTIWSLGCILAVAYKNDRVVKWLPYLSMIIFIYPLINKSNQYYPVSDLIFGLIVVGAISYILNYKKHIINFSLEKFAWLGTFSYSVYLLHSPFLNLYQKIILHNSKDQTLPYHLWYVLISLLITLPLIYVIYYYTERIAINYNRKI